MPTLAPDVLCSLLLPATPALPAAEVNAAAVLLLIAAQPEPHTFLTLRSADMPAHPGQVSLPGGRVALQDRTLEMTALREAQEETSLDPAGLRLLGRLPTVTVAVSGMQVTPVVAWTETSPALQADPREVAEIIPCPLRPLLQPAVWRREALERNGLRREFWVVDIAGHRVWGATAAILRSLACLLATLDDGRLND